MKQLFSSPLEIFNFMQPLKLQIVLSHCKRHFTLALLITYI